MAQCNDCGREMLGAKTCTVTHVTIDGTPYKRDTSHFDEGDRCHDCGIENSPGNIHHAGCDVEACPKCGGQMFCCDCRKGDE